MILSWLPGPSWAVLAGIALLSGGCVPGTGVPYEEAAERTGQILREAAPRSLFGLTQREDWGRTTYRFISGDIRDKAAHAVPARVRVVVLSKDQGRDSHLTAEAYHEVLFLASRDQELARRWRARILGALQGASEAGSGS